MITRYYDRLLDKVTARPRRPNGHRPHGSGLARISHPRRVTNIAFVENLLKHPTFLNNEYHTKFIDETPDLFDFAKRRDRGTKVLTYIADITVNGHPETKGRPPAGLTPRALHRVPSRRSAPDNLLEREGPQALPTGWPRNSNC